jgi:bifunctional non-homologous end joining protein LigD
VVEVEFRGYTEDGLLRQASLKGLRRDRRVDSLTPAGRNVARVKAPAPAHTRARAKTLSRDGG